MAGASGKPQRWTLPMRSIWFLIGTLFLAGSGLPIAGAEPQLNGEPIDYDKQIKPVLRERCFACHGALKQEGGLRVDTAALMLQGGDSGPAIRAGEPESSLLIERVSAAEEAERMPPEGEPLQPAQIAALQAWIRQGGKVLTSEQPEPDPREHWAYQPPQRRPLPVVVDTNWPRNPIDTWIEAERERQQLRAQPPADKSVWLRRVSLDLIGLPPTLEQLNVFLNDAAPDAEDRVVDRLLNSPQHGERWGRHWMDIWRYSDWWGLGAEVRNSQKHIWHWRDWIIESLNTDKGYDQMVREMLAADELYPNDLARLRASGFLARQYFKFNRTSWLDETVEHTSKAFLGLTLNCGKCHAHKYDPFSQAEYYALRAIFEPYQIRTEAVPGEIDFERDGIPRAFDCNLDAQTFVHIRGDDRNPDKSRVIEPAVPQFLAFTQVKFEPITLPVEAHQPGLRPHVVEAYLKRAESLIATARAARETAAKQLAQSEALAAATPPAQPVPDMPVPGNAPPESAAELVAQDRFATANPELWEQRGGTWVYANGKLLQNEIGPVRGTLRLKTLPPVDFDAQLTFVTRGGQMWKSVGIHFDTTETNEALAYVSSYAGGPKSQIAYKQGDNYVYPPDAAQARPIELDQPHQLRLQVRGNLVNVSVDGQHSLAYRLPIARQSGHIELITYDAKAEFLAFELRKLPASTKLVESAAPAKPGSGPLPLDQAKLALTVAEKELAAAEAEPESIRARAAADQARYQASPPADLAERIAAAVRAERVVTALKADEAVSRAELELLRAAADKKAEAEKKLDAARNALATARAAVDQPGEAFTPLAGALKTLESNLESEDSRRKPFPATSTGRRAALANWLTDPRHPLPARVAVNHLWSRHMGRPLVPTVFDFGRKGTPPTHPELLDELARQLLENEWSLKHLHRQIVLSNTYRMTSSAAGAAPEQLAADPDNRYYWRMPSARMDAQLVRDSLLALSEELDLTQGGPSIPVNQEASRRRSLYFVHSHNEHQKFLSMFDDANVLECYRRSESIVPQQALALENSLQAVDAAERITERLGRAASSDEEFLRAAFLTILNVKPSASELELALEGLRQVTEAASRQKRTDPQRQARMILVHALLNHNDFVTIR